jgi:hypothetical protein
MSAVYELIEEYKYKTNLPGICLYAMITRDVEGIRIYGLDYVLPVYYQFVDLYRELADSFAEAYPEYVRVTGRAKPAGR